MNSGNVGQLKREEGVSFPYQALHVPQPDTNTAAARTLLEKQLIQLYLHNRKLRRAHYLRQQMQGCLENPQESPKTY